MKSPSNIKNLESSFHLKSPTSLLQATVLLKEALAASDTNLSSSQIEARPTNIQSNQAWKAQFSWKTQGLIIQNLLGMWELKLILHPMDAENEAIIRTAKVINHPGKLPFEKDTNGHLLKNTLFTKDINFVQGTVKDGIYQIIGQINLRVQSGHIPLCGFVDLGLVNFYGTNIPLKDTEQEGNGKIVVPSSFSPNGDGINDGWIISGIEQFPNNTIEVYNRWGNRVFESIGYSNANPWKGTWENEALPDGTYFYIIKIEKKESIASWLQISR